MKLFPWLSNIPSSDPYPINPATGLPMIGGVGGFDVQGNPYCVNLHAHVRFDDHLDHWHGTGNDLFKHGSSFDHGSIGSAFDSFGGGYGGGGIDDL
jgi:hypothetical protein